MPDGVLAIDHGTKRTGFAGTDPLRITAHPLDVWHGAGDAPELVAYVAELVRERDAGTVVVGLALNMDGTDGARAKETRAFADAVSQAVAGVEVVTWDERLTTKEAEELLREAGHHGADRKARRDSWSALVLLRDWLESN